jgi:hypothetical protein
VPVTRALTPDEIEGEYEQHTGDVIVETFTRFELNPLETPASACPVGCANSVSRGEAVFVDESAEAVAALDAGLWRSHETEFPSGRIGQREVQ